MSVATTLYIDFLDYASANCFNYLNTIDDSTSSIKGTFKLEEKANTQNFAYFSITGSHTHPSDYFQVPVAWLNGATSFSNSLDTIITFTRTGDMGDIGYTGSKGDIGYTGSRGYDGSVGYTGSKGDIGYTGSKGADGTIGYNGSTGYTGSKGDTGYGGSFGASGYTGSIGYTGSLGYTGSQGVIGYTGSAGAASSNTQVIYNANGVLVGNNGLTFDFSANTLNVNGAINATSHSVGTSLVANTTGVFATTINASSNVITTNVYATTVTANTTGIHTGNVVATTVGATTVTANVVAITVGATTVTANVSAQYANVSGQVNTATFYATTSANVGSLLQANTTAYLVSSNSTVNTVITATTLTQANTTVNPVLSANDTGIWHTGRINAASFTVGSSWIANTTGEYLTGSAGVNAVSYNATNFTANTTGVYHSGVVNAASHTVGSTFVINTTAFTASANVALGNNHLIAPVFKATSEFCANSSSTGAVTLDLSTSNMFNLSMTGNTTFTFSNAPSGRAFAFTIIATQDATGGRTITWPAGSKYAGAVSPPATTTANAVDIWSVLTYNGGTTWIVSLAVKNAS